MQDQEIIQSLIDQVRTAVSCCCSYHRYQEINDLLDKMEQVIRSADQKE